MSDDSPKSSGLIGLIAVGFAATELASVTAAVVLPKMGRRWANLATSFSWLVFDSGLLIDAVAVLLAILAIAQGGRGRRAGLLALVFVVMSFFVMFIG